jgi:hypothetical protein
MQSNGKWFHWYRRLSHANDTLRILMNDGKSELNRTAAKVAGRKTIVS